MPKYMFEVLFSLIMLNMLNILNVLMMLNMLNILHMHHNILMLPNYAKGVGLS